jgi:hypothetical protein
LIFAVRVIVMVTGAGPQSNVMMPPAATAFTTASDVQLDGVPLPITRVGRRVSSAFASSGTRAVPPGLPGSGNRRVIGFAGGDTDGTAEAGGRAGIEEAGGAAEAATTDGAGATNDGPAASPPQPVRTTAARRPAAPARGHRVRTGRW